MAKWLQKWWHSLCCVVLSATVSILAGVHTNIAFMSSKHQCLLLHWAVCMIANPLSLWKHSNIKRSTCLADIDLLQIWVGLETTSVCGWGRQQGLLGPMNLLHPHSLSEEKLTLFAAPWQSSLTVRDTMTVIWYASSRAEQENQFHILGAEDFSVLPHQIESFQPSRNLKPAKSNKTLPKVSR